jgi:hypothetical protein
MNTVTRFLLAAATFAGAAVAMYFIKPSLGIELGTWQAAVMWGVIGALASLVWRVTAPSKDRPPPQSK